MHPGVEWFRIKLATPSEVVGCALTRARRGFSRMSTAFLVICTSLSAGCLSPIAMHRAVIEYDRTVYQADAELLLLNIARSRHHRPVHFTAVSSVAASFNFRTNLGVIGRIAQTSGPGTAPVDISYGAEVAENPTVTIVPISGEEFTKRILRPLDESHLDHLARQGFDLSMVLRMLGRGLLIDVDGTRRTLFNIPSHRDGYTEFRRRVLHLAALDSQEQLRIGRITYEDMFPVALEQSLTSAEVVAAIDRAYRWSAPTAGRPAGLVRRITGRLAITNYDLTRLSNDERKRLNEEIDRMPLDSVFIDIRPGSPGGDYPLTGFLQLRSFNAIISSIAREIAEDVGYPVEPDPRTGPVRINPSRLLEVEESRTSPSDAEFQVEFEGMHYSIPRFSVTDTPTSSWNQVAFAVLANLFQMTITDVANIKTPIISISK